MGFWKVRHFPIRHLRHLRHLIRFLQSGGVNSRRGTGVPPVFLGQDAQATSRHWGRPTVEIVLFLRGAHASRMLVSAFAGSLRWHSAGCLAPLGPPKRTLKSEITLPTPRRSGAATSADVAAALCRRCSLASYAMVLEVRPGEPSGARQPAEGSPQGGSGGCQQTPGPTPGTGVLPGTPHAAPSLDVSLSREAPSPSGICAICAICG